MRNPDRPAILTRPTARRLFGLAMLALLLTAQPEAHPASAADPDVTLRLEVTDLSGRPVTEVGVGDRFLLRGHVQDTRKKAKGVFAAFVDVTYDSGVTPAAAIEFGSAFPNSRSGSTDTPGLLDEVGASAGFDPTGKGELLLFSVEFATGTAGTFLFQSDPADDLPAHQILLFGEDVPTTSLRQGVTSVTVAEPPPPPDTILESYLLPKKVTARQNAGKPTRSKLTASGNLDTGPNAANLTDGAELTVGGFTYLGMTVVLRGTKIIYTATGLTLTVIPSKTGSSRARFKLVIVDDLTGKIDLNGTLEMRFTDGDVDAATTVTLAGGRYIAGKVGSLMAPAIYLTVAKGSVKGNSRDKILGAGGLTALVGLGTAPTIRVTIGDSLDLTVPGSAFTRKGSKRVFVFKSKDLCQCSLILDLDRGTLKLKAKNVDLSNLPEGAQPLLNIIGTDKVEGVRVRMSRTGKRLIY